MTNEQNNQDKFLEAGDCQMEYRSLNDIRLRKESLRKSIEADDKKIKTLWNSLFTKPDAFSKDVSKGKRISSMISIGAGAFDVVLLAKIIHCTSNLAACVLSLLRSYLLLSLLLLSLLIRLLVSALLR